MNKALVFLLKTVYHAISSVITNIRFAKYKLKKGEMLYGFQSFKTKRPYS